MTRAEAQRQAVTDLVRAVPFRAFILSLDDGAQVRVDHPENIAFRADDPDGTPGSMDVYVRDQTSKVWTTFDAVTSVVARDSDATLVD